MALDGEAALGAGNSPECGAWAPRARQGLRDLAHGIRGALGRLPRARIGPELQRSGVDVEVRRRRGTEFVARSQACSSGRLGPAGRRAIALCSQRGGQAGKNANGGDELRGRRCLSAAALQAGNRRYASGNRAGSAWETPRRLCRSSARLEGSCGAAEG